MPRGCSSKNSPNKPAFPGLNADRLSDNRLSRLSIHYECLFDHGVNFRLRQIQITDSIKHPQFDIVDAALSEMEADSRKTVTIKINSGGGECNEALAIVGRIKRSSCHIITEGYGQVMSAATLILAAGHKRKISEYSWFMHHESQYEGSGRHSEMKNLVTQAEREERIWARWMARLSDMDAEWWLKEGTGKDAYFTAEQLLQFGVVDEII